MKKDNSQLEIKKEFKNVFKARSPDSNKGSFGSLAVIGGDQGMFGAVILAGMSALKLGCGKVFLSFIGEPNIPYIVNMPELMINSLDKVLDTRLTAIVIGCGLGTTSYSQQVLKKVLKKANHIPLVLDADALNIISENNLVLDGENIKILTPHPGEAARLLNTTIDEIQNNRIANALKISQKYNAITVLKGYKSVIADNKNYWLNTTGNNALATVGTGDVLAGCIGSLLAQKLLITEAVRAAVWMHGAAADYLVKKGVGPIGLIASELLDSIRLIRNNLTFS